LPEPAQIVVADLSQVTQLLTADFARLLAMRRRLLAAGHDLRLTGLRGRTRCVYEMSRLQAALPEAPRGCAPDIVLRLRDFSEA